MQKKQSADCEYKNLQIYEMPLQELGQRNSERADASFHLD